jgi:hypothetical protein
MTMATVPMADGRVARRINHNSPASNFQLSKYNHINYYPSSLYFTLLQTTATEPEN